MPFTTQDAIRGFISAGQVWRAEHSATDVAAAGVSYLGFVTSNVELEALSRSYSSTGNSLTVELFEATFTGGANVRTLNRRMGVAGAPPVQFKTGITPAALTTVKTGLTILAAASTGSAQAGQTSDSSLLILKANTSYVIRLTNSGSGAATVGATIDYRESV